MAEYLAARTIDAADPSRRRRLAREPKTR
jgi:hypothetical protein